MSVGSYWLRWLMFIMLTLLALWFSVKLFFLITEYKEEVFSIKQFQIEVDAIKIQDQNIIVSILFKNLSSKDIKVFHLICEARARNKLVGAYSSDLSYNPIIVENFSELYLKVQMLMGRTSIMGGEIIQVYVRAIVGANFLRIAVEKHENISLNY